MRVVFMNKKILYFMFISSNQSLKISMASVSVASKCNKVSNSNYKSNLV